MSLNATKLARLGFAPSVLALVTMTSSVVPAFADLGSPAVYEIEAKEQYCADSTTQCAPPNQRPDLRSIRFALFEVFRLTMPKGNLERTAHASAALPDALLAKCAGPHSMDGRGNIRATTMSVMVGPDSMGLHVGSVAGSVALHHGLETDALSTATVALEAFDSLSGDSVVVTGTQVANNVTDTLVSGGFNITLHGPQYDEIVAGPDLDESAPPKPNGMIGTLSCSTGNPTISTPGTPPPYFESELFDAVDPTS